MAADKVAVVTGAGSGIGRSAALALHEAGFHVVLAGRRADALQETVGMANAKSAAKLVAIPTNVADAKAVQNLFAEVKRRFGRIDVLFNNAGTGAPAVPVDELSIEKWKEVVDVNLTGSFLCAREAVKMMKEQSPRGGRIINNGSISAHTPRPNSTAYTATKHAITGLTKCLSLDGRNFDIVCSQLDIGNADTPLGGRMKHGVQQANGTVAPEPVIDVAHTGRAIAYMATLPLDVNVQFMTIMATKMPFVGRG